MDNVVVLNGSLKIGVGNAIYTLEPSNGDGLAIRVSLDGVPQEIAILPVHETTEIMSRIKNIVICPIK